MIFDLCSKIHDFHFTPSSQTFLESNICIYLKSKRNINVIVPDKTFKSRFRGRYHKSSLNEVIIHLRHPVHIRQYFLSLSLLVSLSLCRYLSLSLHLSLSLCFSLCLSISLSRCISLQLYLSCLLCYQSFGLVVVENKIARMTFSWNLIQGQSRVQDNDTRKTIQFCVVLCGFLFLNNGKAHRLLQLFWKIFRSLMLTLCDILTKQHFLKVISKIPRTMAYSLASRKEFILCINIEPITVFIRYPSWQEFAPN